MPGLARRHLPGEPGLALGKPRRQRTFQTGISRTYDGDDGDEGLEAKPHAKLGSAAHRALHVVCGPVWPMALHWVHIGCVGTRGSVAGERTAANHGTSWMSLSATVFFSDVGQRDLVRE